MKIENISGVNPSSRGYLHKSVYKYIDTASSNAKLELRGIESKVPKNQFRAAIKQIESVRKATIQNLELFIQKCHEKTYLIIEDRENVQPSMNLNNKKMQLDFGIPGVNLLKLDGMFNDNEVVLPIREHVISKTDDGLTIGGNELNRMKRFSDELIQINGKSADKAILRCYISQTEENEHSIWGKLNHKKHQRKIEHFEKEIGA